MAFEDGYEPDITIYDILPEDYKKFVESCLKQHHIIELFDDLVFRIRENINKLLELHGHSKIKLKKEFEIVLDTAYEKKIISERDYKKLTKFRKVRNKLTHQRMISVFYWLIIEDVLEINFVTIKSKIVQKEYDKIEP